MFFSAFTVWSEHEHSNRGDTTQESASCNSWAVPKAMAATDTNEYCFFRWAGFSWDGFLISWQSRSSILARCGGVGKSGNQIYIFLGVQAATKQYKLFCCFKPWSSAFQKCKIYCNRCTELGDKKYGKTFTKSSFSSTNIAINQDFRTLVTPRCVDGFWYPEGWIRFRYEFFKTSRGFFGIWANPGIEFSWFRFFNFSNIFFAIFQKSKNPQI